MTNNTLDESFISSILNGEFASEESEHKQNVSARFFENVEKARCDLEKEFKKCKTGLASIKLFKKYFEWIDINKNELKGNKIQCKFSF